MGRPRSGRWTGTPGSAAGQVTSNLSSLGWDAVATGDFNDDTLPDILWQDPSSGRLGTTEMNGTSQINGQVFDPSPGPSWRVIGTGDFNGDHFSDILWQNTATGQASIWETANGRDDLLSRGTLSAQSRADLASGRNGRLQRRWEG